jgi:hypothetical protein
MRPTYDSSAMSDEHLMGLTFRVGKLGKQAKAADKGRPHVVQPVPRGNDREERRPQLDSAVDHPRWTQGGRAIDAPR